MTRVVQVDLLHRGHRLCLWHRLFLRLHRHLRHRAFRQDLLYRLHQLGQVVPVDRQRRLVLEGPAVSLSQESLLRLRRVVPWHRVFQLHQGCRLFHADRCRRSSHPGQVVLADQGVQRDLVGRQVQYLLEVPHTDTVWETGPPGYVVAVPPVHRCRLEVRPYRPIHRIRHCLEHPRVRMGLGGTCSMCQLVQVAQAEPL